MPAMHDVGRNIRSVSVVIDIHKCNFTMMLSKFRFQAASGFVSMRTNSASTSLGDLPLWTLDEQSQTRPAGVDGKRQSNVPPSLDLLADNAIITP